MTPNIIEKGSAGSAISKTLKRAIVINNPYALRILVILTERMIMNTNTKGTDDDKLAFDTIKE